MKAIPTIELFFEAVRSSNISEIESILTRGFDVNSKYEDGTTALHEAVKCGYQDVISILLRRGAHVNVRDNSGLTAIEHAKEESLFKYVQTNTEYQNYDRSNNLNTTSRQKRSSSELESEEPEAKKGKTSDPLQDNEEEMVVLSRSNFLTLYKITQCVAANIQTQEDVDQMMMILNTSVSEHSQYLMNYCVREAVKDNRYQDVELLIKKNVDLRSIDENGNTLLHIATGLGGAINMIELLASSINDKAFLNLRNNDGLSALCIAYHYEDDYEDQCAVLLKFGADISGIDDTPSNNASLFEICVSEQFMDIANHIISNRAFDMRIVDSNTLRYAITNLDLEMVQCLVDNGFDVNSSISPLHYLLDVWDKIKRSQCYDEQVKTIKCVYQIGKILLNSGADIEINDNITLLARSGSPVLIRLFICYGADINNDTANFHFDTMPVKCKVTFETLAQTFDSMLKSFSDNRDVFFTKTNNITGEYRWAIYSKYFKNLGEKIPSYASFCSFLKGSVKDNRPCSLKPFAEVLAFNDSLVQAEVIKHGESKEFITEIYHKLFQEALFPDALFPNETDKDKWLASRSNTKVVFENNYLSRFVMSFISLDDENVSFPIIYKALREKPSATTDVEEPAAAPIDVVALGEEPADAI